MVRLSKLKLDPRRKRNNIEFKGNELRDKAVKKKTGTTSKVKAKTPGNTSQTHSKAGSKSSIRKLVRRR
jgi:hypothetical protein